MDKITALKKTIYNLENDVYEYNWGRYESCNCGVLAKSILSADNIKDFGIGNSPSRKRNGASSEYYCMTTDLPIPAVFQAVKDAGFSFAEMVELECLTNTEILKLSGVSSYELCHFEKKENLIKYLKAWVEILEEKLNKEPEVQASVATEVDSKKEADPINTFKEVTFSKIKENIPSLSSN